MKNSDWCTTNLTKFILSEPQPLQISENQTENKKYRNLFSGITKTVLTMAEDCVFRSQIKKYVFRAFKVISIVTSSSYWYHTATACWEKAKSCVDGNIASILPEVRPNNRLCVLYLYSWFDISWTIFIVPHSFKFQNSGCIYSSSTFQWNKILKQSVQGMYNPTMQGVAFIDAKWMQNEQSWDTNQW